MATTSIADKLMKLEKKIAKRQATIVEEQKQAEEIAERMTAQMMDVEGVTLQLKAYDQMKWVQVKCSVLRWRINK